MTKLAVIGVGKMGESLVRGLLASGWSPDDIVLTDVRADHAAAVAERLGVAVAPTNADAAGRASGVVFAVLPQQAADALGDLRGSAKGVLSIVMGLPTAAIEDALGEGVPVVRAMPNALARIGKGVTALAAGRNATDDLKQLAGDVFSAVGPVVWIGEDGMDAVTALSGSGPAYVYLVAESMIEAGIAVGLTRDVASTLTYATIEGAGRMLAESGEHPAVLKAQVTSPAGTTAAALSVLEAMGVRAAFIEAIRAAHRRSVEVSRRT